MPRARAGSTRATARCRGARAAARRCRSTSCIDSLPGPRPTRRCTCYLPLADARRRGARGLDDHALDAARQRRRRGQARRASTSRVERGTRPASGSSRSAREAVFGGGATASCDRARGSSSSAGPTTARSTSLPAQAEVAAPRDRVGRRRRRRGHRHRPHRARLRRRGLRARQARGPARARAGRRGRRLLRAVRLAARPPHARDVTTAIVERPRPARPPAARRAS